MYYRPIVMRGIKGCHDGVYFVYRGCFAGKGNHAFRVVRGKSKGSVMDFMTIGITILAMAILWMAYMGMAQLLDTKTEVSQVARKYLLRMETVGYLNQTDQEKLITELAGLGVTKVELAGTTTTPVGYGESIYLMLEGCVQGSTLEKERMWSDGLIGKEYTIKRYLMSTAKN